MVTIILWGGVFISALVRQAQLEQSCLSRPFQEPCNGNALQLHFVPHVIQNGSMKHPTWWALTVVNLPNCLTMVWLNQPTIMQMIPNISVTTISLNAFSSSCNSHCSGNICLMHQQRNSIMLRNVSTQRWNQASGGGMKTYVSWISTYLRWF